MRTAIVTGLVIVGLASGVAVAQSAPWRLVQTGDGSLHVIADGFRHRIAPAPIADAELAAVPEAESWDSTFAPVIPVAQQPPAPESQGKRVGNTTVITAPSGLRLAVTVMAVTDPVRSTNERHQASGRWVVLDWEVKNEGTTNFYANALHLKLQTVDNFVIDRGSHLGFPEPRFDSGTIGPGQGVRGYLAYDGPAGQRLKSAIFQAGNSPQFVIVDFG
jgi:hypothetical protein